MLEYVFLGVNGSVQDAESGNTSLVVTDGYSSILVDSSVNISYALSCNVDAVFITHEHIDHLYALPSLLHQSWLTGRTKKLTIICSEGINGTVNGLIDIFSLRQKNDMFEIELSNESVFKFGSMKIECFKTDHTDNSYGICVSDGTSKLVYTSDTRPLENIPQCFYGSDLIICEASGLYKDRDTLIKKGHSSAYDAAFLACKIKPKRLELCHLCADKSVKREILEEASALFAYSCIPVVLEKKRVL